MVYLRMHRRAASVPVGEPSLADDAELLAAKNSYLFSRAAIDNNDALSSASKKHDQQLLRDINARIGSASFTQPMPRHIRRALQPSAPPSPALRRRSIAVSSVLRPPLVTDSYDDDVDYEVRLIAPLTNRLRHGGTRAASVPPPSTTVTVTEGGGSGVVLPPAVSRIYGGHYYPHQGTYFLLSGSEHSPLLYDLETRKQTNVTVPTFQKLNPLADLAVRQAHGNLDRIEREIRSSGDVIISRPILPRSVLYTSPTEGPRRRSLSYHGPRSSSWAEGPRGRSPSPVRRSPATVGRRSYVRTTYVKPFAPVVSDDELFDYLSPAKPYRNVKAEMLLAGVRPDLGVSGIRYPVPSVMSPAAGGGGGGGGGGGARLTNALLYDLHLNSPGDIAIPVSHNIFRKVSAGSTPLLIHRAAHHHHHHHHALPHHALSHHALPHHALPHHALPHHTVTTPYVAPTIPATLSTIFPKPPIAPAISKPIPVPPVTSSIPRGLPPVIRPRVSETRRKVRDVLCKVKGDPHYFDL